MKKLFTFLGALLLWQAMAVAQNHLYVYHGDTCVTKVPIANLDSATVRQTEFYEPLYLCQGVFNESFFYSGAFEVSVYALGDKLIVKDADVYEGFTFTYNSSGENFIVKEQETNYYHPEYGMIRVLGQGVYNSDEDIFYFELQYIVDAGTFGTYPVTLQLLRSASAAHARNHKEEGPEFHSTSELKRTPLTKRLKKDGNFTLPTKKTNNEAPQQLMMCPVDQTIK